MCHHVYQLCIGRVVGEQALAEALAVSRSRRNEAAQRRLSRQKAVSVHFVPVLVPASPGPTSQAVLACPRSIVWMLMDQS